MYGPPDLSTDDLSYISDAVHCLQHLCNTSRILLLLGDFNLQAVDWQYYSTSDNNIYRLFMNFVNNYGFCQFVHTPTRGDSILELVLCTADQDIIELLVDSPFSNSDHCAVLFMTEENNFERLDKQSDGVFLGRPAILP